MKFDYLNWSRQGIYNPIDQEDSIRLNINGKIKSNYWEISIDLHGFEQVIPIGVSQTVERGEKPKRLKDRKNKMQETVITKLKIPVVSYTVHTLQRLRERSFKKYNFENFMNVNEDWVRFITDVYDARGGPIFLQSDLMLPFGDGVLMGYSGLFEGRSALFKRTNGKTTWTYDNRWSGHFVARTFLHRDELSAPKKKILDLITKGDFSRAKDLLSQRANEKHEIRHGSQMKFLSNQLVQVTARNV